MAGIKGKFSGKDFKKLQEQMNKLAQQDKDAFITGCAKEIAARLLGKVVKRTPVGVYPKSTGKHGGTLRRSWTIQEMVKEGNVYRIDIVNPMEYASYVEYGHRQTPGRYVPALGKRLKKGWVQGRFMLTISEQEVQKLTPKLLEARLEKYLREAMG